MPRFSTISEEEIEIIIQAKNSQLFHNNEPWKKSNSEDLFDITMGSYDGAETCELVAIGTYILSEITKNIHKENIGLYRGDGLAIM